MSHLIDPANVPLGITMYDTYHTHTVRYREGNISVRVCHMESCVKE